MTATHVLAETGHRRVLLDMRSTPHGHEFAMKKTKRAKKAKRAKKVKKKGAAKRRQKGKRRRAVANASAAKPVGPVGPVHDCSGIPPPR